MIDQTKSPPRARGLQFFINMFLLIKSKAAEARASKDETRNGEVRGEIGGGEEVGGEVEVDDEVSDEIGDGEVDGSEDLID